MDESDYNISGQQEELLSRVQRIDDRLLLMEQAISCARNGVIITDPRLEDNPIIYVNPAFISLTGYSFDEIVGKNCRFLQNDDRKQEACNDIRIAIEQAEPITRILRNYRKNGTMFWNELTISPVRDRDGLLIAFVGIQNDVSARIEAEKRVSEFYSVVSHELRTPLTSMRVSLSLLEDGSIGPISKEVQSLIDIAYKNTGRLLRLINEILDFRKIESGKLSLKIESLSFKQILNTVLDELRQMAVDRNISFVESIEFDGKFMADYDRTVQILDNLMANAIKFSPDGSLVTIGCTQTRSGYIRIFVADEGPGISESDFSMLFEKFQQLDSSDRRTTGGTGLGLAICRELVLLQGGDIGVESKLGEGSLFWFELPLAK